MPLRYPISPVPPDGIKCWLDSADRSTIACLTQELNGAAPHSGVELFTARPIERMLWSVRVLTCDERRDFELIVTVRNVWYWVQVEFERESCFRVVRHPISVLGFWLICSRM